MIKLRQDRLLVAIGLSLAYYVIPNFIMSLPQICVTTGVLWLILSNLNYTIPTWPWFQYLRVLFKFNQPVLASPNTTKLKIDYFYTKSTLYSKPKNDLINLARARGVNIDSVRLKRDLISAIIASYQ